MRALKVLIVIMGVILVFGFAILAVMVVKKIKGFDEENPKVQEVIIPKGFEVKKIMEVSEKVLVHLKSGNKKEQILLINPNSGQEIARISTDQSDNKPEQ